MSSGLPGLTLLTPTEAAVSQRCQILPATPLPICAQYCSVLGAGSSILPCLIPSYRSLPNAPTYLDPCLLSPIPQESQQHLQVWHHQVHEGKNLRSIWQVKFEEISIVTVIRHTKKGRCMSLLVFFFQTRRILAIQSI